jgi:hypothetical protein
MRAIYVRVIAALEAYDMESTRLLEQTEPSAN